MPVSVRPVEPRDREAWTRLFRAYVEFYKADVPDAIVALTWQRLFGSAPEFYGLVAVDAGEALVGILVAVFHRSTWSPTWVCYLEDLFVAPDARGSGAGRALIEALYREADARGATRTYWVTEETNTTARALYDRLATKAPFVQYRR
ncbi:MAG: GNAT family N-acetyltransferase [Proteobacteria bacterium]|nr:GNAT family N-acetyltransferase [Pseudomonadota bacterium]